MFELQIADRREGGGTKWQTIKCEKFATKKGIMSLKWPANVFVKTDNRFSKEKNCYTDRINKICPIQIRKLKSQKTPFVEEQESTLQLS